MNTKKNSDGRWKKSTASFFVVYSILAAIASVIFATILAADDKSHLKELWYLTIAPLGLSIFLFIYSGEKILDAMDEDDVQKYLSLLILYNLAVILLFWGLLASIYIRYVYEGEFCSRFQYFKFFLFILVFLLFAKHWIWHEIWLLFTSRRNFEQYIDELEGRTTPGKDRHFGFWLFMRWRRVVTKNEIANTFKEIRYELRPSAINGIGLFAIKNFLPDELVAEGISATDLENIVKWSEITHIDDNIKTMINNFCIGTPDGFIPPPDLDFNNLTPDWFMNHSCDGNVGFNEDGNFVAIRSIKNGDELTYDYGLAESNPDFVMNCVCGSTNCRRMITGNDWKDPVFRKDNKNYMLPSLRTAKDKF
jgi:hypothetical protein